MQDMQPQDLIINIKIVLNVISDKSRNEKEKASRAIAFQQFTGLLEETGNRAQEIIVRSLNNLSNDAQIAKFIEKICGKGKIPAYAEIINNFNSVLPMPEVREKTAAVKAAINAILVLLKEGDFEKLQEVLRKEYISTNLKNLLNALIKANAEMPELPKIKVYGCDEAANSPNFIEQRDKKELGDFKSIIGGIAKIMAYAHAGLNPANPEPRHYPGGLYGAVIGSARRLIFYELEKQKSFLICVYIDEKTHNDAVNKNINNIYRKVIGGELTPGDYAGMRRIDPETLADIKDD